ncbi:MAG: hypothetical protein JW731_04640 [Bacteroidales bacterium]|nr:hypothetical protein [Bacteroidales bacterium]
MKRKFSVTIIIFFSAFMLNVSAMAFQQRYDRREDDEDFDPFVIEMTDLNVFKYLKNTWYFDFPIEKSIAKIENGFYLDKAGFGNQYFVSFHPFKTCQLKFVFVEYLGFFEQKIPGKTYYLQLKSG